MKIHKSRDLLTDFMERLRPAANPSPQPAPVYGFLSADGTDDVVRRGELVLLMGRDPDTLMTNLLASESCLWERPSVSLCLKTPPGETVVKVLSSISGADLKQLQTERIAPHSFSSVNAAALDLLHSPLWFADPQTVDLSSLERVVVKTKKRHGIREAFIDDITRIQGAAQANLHQISNALRGC